MSYKGKFNESLSMIPAALNWAGRQDVEGLRKFFMEHPQQSLYCLGSGGSFSAMDYAALLYEANQGMAKALTPLSMSSISDKALAASKIFFTTTAGRGVDEKYVAKRAAKVNPKNSCASNDKPIFINTKFVVFVEPVTLNRFHHTKGSLITLSVNGREGLHTIKVIEPCQVVLKAIEKSIGDNPES